MLFCRDRFFGKFVEVRPEGVCCARFDNAVLRWSKPFTCLQNVIVGALWIDVYGDVVVRDSANPNVVCRLRLIAQSWFSKVHNSAECE